MSRNRNDLLLSFYGDDFTGSTDVMETLSINGIPTVLFLDAPEPEEVLQFRLKEKLGGNKLRAFGVAGISRSLSPDEMKKELEPIFRRLKSIPTDFFQYKVCSTLDSSPKVGNIGVATEVASRSFDASRIPMVIGAPFLNRFVVFSNLFARICDRTYRLDRHPVMSRHPVTPMRESDIRLHMALQSGRSFKTLDILQLQATKEELTMKYAEIDDGSFLLFDTIDYDHLAMAGALIYEGWKGKTELLVGSSGITFGLASYMQKKDPGVRPATVNNPGKAEHVLVVSGSCSPITASQMQFACKRDFIMIPVDTEMLIEDSTTEADRLISQALKTMQKGKHPIIHSANGPDDPSIGRVKDKLGERTGQVIGALFGQIVSDMLKKVSGIRLVVVGGDTSGYVSRSLQIYALEMLCPVAPGAPLCVAHTRDSHFDGLEVALKGGQNGKDDYFQRILEGKSN